MAFELPDIWTVSGVGLALLAIAPAMTSVPGPGHWEFRISRICFVGAAILFSAKLAFWGAEDLSLIRVGIVAVVGAMMAVALTYAINWVNLKEHPKADAAASQAKLAQEEGLGVFVEFTVVPFPDSVPPNAFTMGFGPKQAPIIWQRVTRNGTPPEPARDFQPNNMWRVSVTNYENKPNKN
jgi:hypothetical protein